MKLSPPDDIRRQRTTPEEFYAIETDPAFKRRFQHLGIDPFSVQQSIEVLMQDKGDLQEEYKKRMKRPFLIERSACEAATHLAVKYLPQEFLPGSALKILNAACSFGNANLPMERSPHVIVREHTVVGFVSSFYKKEKNGESRQAVERELSELKAELHPLNQIIPLHEPLMLFSDNWTTKARRGLFKPSFHREQDMRLVIQTLGCKTINNVLLCGRAGSGKTSLAQQLAIDMVNNKVPPFLQDRLFLALKLQDLLDKAKTFPRTITDFIESLRRSAGKYVLFIDEFHTFFQIIVDGVPLYEQLKPLLAEGKVRLIGATTPEEATAYISNKGESIERRFILHYLSELSESQSIGVLTQSKADYESFYTAEMARPFVIDPLALPVVVSEAKKRMNRALPANAITLLEETCSEMGMKDASKAEVKVGPEDVLRYAEKRYPLPVSLKSRLWRAFARFFEYVRSFWPLTYFRA